MRRLFLLGNLFIYFFGSAMNFSTPEQSSTAKKYQAASNQFREGIVITETGNETGDYNERAIFTLKRLEVDKKSLMPLDDDIAAKQLVANAISRKVVFSIVQKKNLTTASEWLNLQKAFTQDLESVAQNEFLLRSAEAKRTEEGCSPDVAFSLFGIL